MVELNDDVREHGITIDQAIEVLGEAATGCISSGYISHAAFKWGYELLTELKRERITREMRGKNVTNY